ncbi:MAG: MFS transporter [Clostridia bacterium]|nr:MFS transporter [Clostridia bacterium]
MATFFLILIYLAFISLGLPDSLLGAVWPAMGPGLSAPLEGAGAISLIITCGTITSSLISGFLIQKLGTGKVTCISVAMTAAALLGFSVTPSFGWLCLAAVPLGLGAGAVDAALNQYVAIHYAAKHMNWLHCFWGVGATAGPVLLSVCMVGAGGWRRGYFVISILQWTLSAVLLLSLPKWKKEREESGEATREKVSLRGLKGMGITLFAFFCYCSLEATSGLWGSSYLTGARGLPPEQAALWISLFYMGITAGRLLAGFATHRLGNQELIRLGEGLCALGVVLLLLPLPVWFAMLGFTLLGLGCAPIYPGMLHETPNRFGPAASQAMMGLQMAVAYLGNATIPPSFGLLAGKVGAGVLPVCLLLLVVGLTVATERVNRVTHTLS